MTVHQFICRWFCQLILHFRSCIVDSFCISLYCFLHYSITTVTHSWSQLSLVCKQQVSYQFTNGPCKGYSMWLSYYIENCINRKLQHPQVLYYIDLLVAAGVRSLMSFNTAVIIFFSNTSLNHTWPYVAYCSCLLEILPISRSPSLLCSRRDRVSFWWRALTRTFFAEPHSTSVTN